jgi:hypothetical protein
VEWNACHGFISMTGGFSIMRLPLLACLLLFPGNVLAQFFSIPPISHPRYASGDIDGDGTVEIVVGGRVGPFKAITDPLSTKRARVDLYRRGGNDLSILATGPDLNQVDDVATGNLNSESGMEILAVGAGRLFVLGWTGDRLAIRNVENLPSGSSQRIETIDIDNDGSDELILTRYGLSGDGDVGTTSVNVYSWETGKLSLLQTIDLRTHVGDLAVVEDAEPKLILETGTGDEGGEVRVFGLGLTHHREIWRGQATEHRNRALSLASIPGTGHLVVGSVTGDVRLFLLEKTGMSFRGKGPSQRNISGILLLDDGLEVLSVIGTSTTSQVPASILPLSF